jgi:hypothetical protein
MGTLRVNTISATTYYVGNLKTITPESGIISNPFGPPCSPDADQNGAATRACGDFSHTEGFKTSSSTIADYSHAEGIETITRSVGSHAEGYKTIAIGQGSHTEGYQTTAGTSTFVGQYSHAEGLRTRTEGDNSHSEGWRTITYGEFSHAEGQVTIASGQSSHAEGAGSISIGIGSHAEGEGTISYGSVSHAEGHFTQAIGRGSHSEGSYTITRAEYSHAEGYQTTAGTSAFVGQYSHAEGYQTRTQGDYSHAEGYQTIASGRSSHASGINSVAIGENSFVHGSGSTAHDVNTIVLGSNIEGYLPNTTYVNRLNIQDLQTVQNGTTTKLGITNFGQIVKFNEAYIKEYKSYRALITFNPLTSGITATTLENTFGTSAPTWKLVEIGGNPYYLRGTFGDPLLPMFFPTNVLTPNKTQFFIGSGEENSTVPDSGYYNTKGWVDSISSVTFAKMDLSPLELGLGAGGPPKPSQTTGFIRVPLEIRTYN